MPVRLLPARVRPSLLLAALTVMPAERGRNEVIFSFQGNRNPFIDPPQWATSALFTSTKPAGCQLN